MRLSSRSNLRPAVRQLICLGHGRVGSDFATWDPVRAWPGAILFGGINAIQLRMQAAGTTIPAAFLHMLPFFFTIVILVVITWWETVRKRVGAPAALGLPYVREEKG
jgi:ABC-type uncharacterized transport system permease subunit